MILGLAILFEIQIYLCSYDKTISGNGGADEECATMTIDVTTIMSSAHSHNKNFHHEDMRKSEHVLDATRNTHHIFESHYDKSDLRKVA